MNCLILFRGGGGNSRQNNPPPSSSSSDHHNNGRQGQSQGIPLRNNHQNVHHQNSDDCDSDIGHIDVEGGGNGNNSHARNNSVRVVPKNLKHFSISRKLAKFAKEKKAAKTL